VVVVDRVAAGAAFVVEDDDALAVAVGALVVVADALVVVDDVFVDADALVVDAEAFAAGRLATVGEAAVRSVLLVVENVGACGFVTVLLAAGRAGSFVVFGETFPVFFDTLRKRSIED
jgi:hypothetical protein